MVISIGFPSTETATSDAEAYADFVTLVSTLFGKKASIFYYNTGNIVDQPRILAVSEGTAVFVYFNIAFPSTFLTDFPQAIQTNLPAGASG